MIFPDCASPLCLDRSGPLLNPGISQLAVLYGELFTNDYSKL